MKTNKASGPNSIPTKMLKLFKKEFRKPLSDIINLSFNQGIFPNLLKIANVTPIHKNIDKLHCNNYRPISLLSNGILLSKLNHYGVRGASYQWFKSYLTGRQQYTTISHLKSDLCSINYGVPQGSVLGPILFLLYINDLNQAIYTLRYIILLMTLTFYMLVILYKN